MADFFVTCFDEFMYSRVYKRCLLPNCSEPFDAELAKLISSSEQNVTYNVLDPHACGTFN